MRTQVKVKRYEATAFLRVPHPTGQLIARGFLPPGANGGAERPMAAPSDGAGNHVGSVGRDAVQAGTYHDHRVLGVGSARDVNNVITGSRGSVHIGSGNDVAGERPRRDRRSRRDG